MKHIILAAVIIFLFGDGFAQHPSLETARIRPTIKTGFANGGWKYDRYKEMESLDAHKAMVLADLKGPGVITHIHTTRHQPVDLFARGIVLEIWFDDADEPAVQTPLADFFGDGCNGKSMYFTSLLIECAPWSYNCYIPMPFKKNAKVILRNDTDRNAMNYSYVEWETLPSWDKDLGYFHATYDRKSFQLTKDSRITFFETEGKGHILGRQFSVLSDDRYFNDFNTVMEGNNEIDIDGTERKLDYLGTEDSFTFSWGFNAPYAGLRAGMPYVEKYSTPDSTLNQLSIYRFHEYMPIRYAKTIKWTIDWTQETHFVQRADWPGKVDAGGCWVDYATVFYWYSDKPGGYKHQPLPPVSERKKLMLHLSSYDAVSRVKTGTPVSVMLTTYSTTLMANGKDQTKLRIAIADSLGREITSAHDTIQLYVSGKGTIADQNGKELILLRDTTGAAYAECQLTNGVCLLSFKAGIEPGKVKLEARSGKLWPGSHEIHIIPGDIVMLKPTPEQLPETTKPIDRMIGADISFLPQFEDRGMKFYDNGQEKDAIQLLRDNGFNYIRLRIFVNPENEKGYSPNTGYCGLSYTLGMAKRIKAAGMKLLLDYHYSDYWADPQQQNKPNSWAELDFETLKDSMRFYTSMVLRALQMQGTMPDMVQIGNEINHGLLWPDGHISQPDQLADLLQAAVQGVEEVDPDLPVMMHIALGGQNDEAVFWLDNMIARGVHFDIIGLSYYPRWHGTLEDLDANLLDLIERYHKPLNVVEYSDYKREIHDMVFNLPNKMGKGAAIWEPLGWRSGLFDRDGGTTGMFSIYRELNTKYLDQK